MKVKNTYYLISMVHNLDSPYINVKTLLEKGIKVGLYNNLRIARQEYYKLPFMVSENENNVGKYDICYLHENEYWVDEEISKHDFYIISTLKPDKVISHSRYLDDRVEYQGFKKYSLKRFKNIYK